MSNATKKPARPPQFSCEADATTMRLSDDIKKKHGIVKKFQLVRGLQLLAGQLATKTTK